MIDALLTLRMNCQNDSGTIIDGKLYLNNNQKSFEIWERDTERNINKADQYWVEIISED